MENKEKIEKFQNEVLSRAKFLADEYGFEGPSFFKDTLISYSKNDLGMCFRFDPDECAVRLYFYDAQKYPEYLAAADYMLIEDDYFKRLGVCPDYDELSKHQTNDKIFDEVVRETKILKAYAAELLADPIFVKAQGTQKRSFLNLLKCIFKKPNF